MKIALVSLLVENQDRALHFYTSALGFKPKHDIPMGEYRWLTVTSPEGAAGVELALEPLAFPPSRIYQQALFEAGIPATAFMSNDITAEYTRLKQLGRRAEETGGVTVAMF